MGRTAEATYSTLQPQYGPAPGETLDGQPQNGSIYRAPLTESDFAALDQTRAYSTPNQEIERVSWGSSGRDPGAANYAPVLAELRQGALARPPYTPEETPPLSSRLADGTSNRSGRNLRKRPTQTISSTPCDDLPQTTGKRRKTQDASSILPKPLSEIAQDFPDIPVTDVAAFAARSTEERHGASTADGKIKRPLNAFMMYRKAYQRVAMAYCGSSSHQTVSQACGASWRCLEPAHIRKKFKDLADTETIKHKEAHPTYKYVPKKSGPEVEADSAGHWEVGDADYGRSRRASRRATRSGGPKQEVQNDEPAPVFRQEHLQPMDIGGLGQGVSREGTPYFGDLASQQPLQPPYAPFSLEYAAPLAYPHPEAGLWEPQAAYPLPGAAPGWPGQGQMGFSGCVDPRLFEPMMHPVDGLPREPPMAPRGVLPTVDGSQGVSGVMPDLDEHGAHNAYLRGNWGDWKVEPLDEADHFYEATYAEDWSLRG